MIYLALAGYLAARGLRPYAPAAALPWIALAVPVAVACLRVLVQTWGALDFDAFEPAAWLGVEAGALAIGGRSALGPVLRAAVPARLRPALDMVLGGER